MTKSSRKFRPAMPESLGKEIEALFVKYPDIKNVFGGNRIRFVEQAVRKQITDIKAMKELGAKFKFIKGSEWTPEEYYKVMKRDREDRIKEKKEWDSELENVKERLSKYENQFEETKEIILKTKEALLKFYEQQQTKENLDEMISKRKKE